jgi:predicted nucleic acid-binding protein
LIVVDTNVLTYLYLPGRYSAASEKLLLRDSEWAVPRLWRSEFSNVLATYMRNKLLALDDAIAIWSRARALVAGREYDVVPIDVLRLAHSSGCSAYDCEFVVLAEHLDVKLVSADAKLCKAFGQRSEALASA